MRYFIILLCLFISHDLSAQQCVSLDDLTTIYLKNNEEILSAKKALLVSYLTYRNASSKWDLDSKVDLSLPYSKSIESVVSSDGNANFVQREYSSPLATITAIKKIPFTGGEIGVNGNIGFFKNFLRSGTQYNANWFNVSLIQPIGAFNEFKYEMAAQKIDIHLDSINYYKFQEEKIRSFVELVIDYEILRMKINYVSSSLDDKQRVLENSILLFDNGRSLASDTLLASYIFEKSLLEKWQFENNLREKRNELSRLIKVDYDFVVCASSEVRFYTLDTVFLKEIYNRFNEESSFARDSFVVYQNIKRVAKNTGIVTGINAGVGANKTAMDFNQLFFTPAQRQNFSLTTSVPITGWAIYRRNKRIAKLEKDIFESKRVISYNHAAEWSITVFQDYSFLVSSYSLSKKNAAIQEILINTIQLKSNAGSMNLVDYQRALMESDNAILEKYETIKQLQLFRYKIRSETLFDIETNKFVFN